VELIIRNLLQLAFVTPIFWDFRHVPRTGRSLSTTTSFSILSELMRGPLLGDVPPAQYYEIVLVVTVVGYFLTYLTYLLPYLPFTLPTLPTLPIVGCGGTWHFFV
jgi:ABC-type polysaccharide/polyol phosphate export permease